jgi:hypothetical protein
MKYTERRLNAFNGQGQSRPSRRAPPARGRSLGVDVTVILTPPCIFYSESLTKYTWWY